MRNFPRRLCGALLFCAAVGLAATPPRAAGDHLLPTQPLLCAENFPCPPEIQPRVQFWISVFRRWDKNTAILHDAKHPQRVYAVIRSKHGCSGKRGPVGRARDTTHKALRALAAKIAAGKDFTGANEQHLAALFAEVGARKQRAAEMRAAAQRVRCQRGVRDSFLQGLRRFDRYQPMIDRILAEHKLPAEIRYLPFVESSYNPAAYSKAGAAGMWQIMPKTARVLGLELNATIDERLDPEAATRAAAKYLLRAEQTLRAAAQTANPDIAAAELNPFVITSYNYGVSGMKRAIRRVGADYMEVLARHKSPRFRVAVRNFYASFLAARHVAMHAESYFGKRAPATVAQTQTVVLPQPISIARVKEIFGLNEARLRPLNRALTRYVWRGWRPMPAGYRLKLPYRENNWRPQRARLASLRPEPIHLGGEYVVRRGDTACGIARALRVNCSELIRANNLGRAALIRVNQKLVIPGAVAAGQARGDSYRVRRGDTVCGIAQQFGVQCRVLLRLNQLGRAAKIYPGQTLYLPGERAQANAKLNADNQYVVLRGDSLCRIAQRFAVHCRAVAEINGLAVGAVIHPGQKLNIPGRVAPSTSQTAQQLARVNPQTNPGAENNLTAAAANPRATQPPGAAEDATATAEPPADPSAAAAVAVNPAPPDADTLRNLLDTLPPLGIRVDNDSGLPIYRARVEANETLGHFADWLGLGGTRALRELNGLRDNNIAIGRWLQLPLRDANVVAKFEQQRVDYHQVLSESLKEYYDLVGMDTYQVQAGDSVWLLSRQFGFPQWLLYRLNPSLREDANLQRGQRIVLPKLKAKG